MSRLRNVGKQAANPLDLAQLRDINALATTAAATYVPLNSANQGTGYPRLDSNARILNAQMPTDPSFTTAKTTGKATLALLDVTGTAALKANATVGGRLDVTGDMAAASLTVNGGGVTAGTADIPEITSLTFKAKATTLESLSVTGATNVAALNMSGSTVGQSISGTAISSSGDVVATNEVRGGTLRSLGDMNVEGDWINGKNEELTGTMRAAFVVSSNTMYADGGFRLGLNKTISQVDANNNNIPVKIAGGLDVNGPLNNVTSLSVSSNLNITGLVTASGKGTFGDLESKAGLKLAGAITGATDLSITGNLSVQGAGKQISATAVSTGTLSASGASTLAAVTASGLVTANGGVTTTQATLTAKASNANHAIRFNEGYVFHSSRRANGAQYIPHNAWTAVQMPTWVFQTDGGLSAPNTTDFTVVSGYDGLWLVEAKIKFTYNQSSQGSRIIRITKNGVPIGWSDTIGADSWLSCMAVTTAVANDVFRAEVFQFTGGALNLDYSAAPAAMSGSRLRGTY